MYIIIHIIVSNTLALYQSLDYNLGMPSLNSADMDQQNI